MAVIITIAALVYLVERVGLPLVGLGARLWAARLAKREQAQQLKHWLTTLSDAVDDAPRAVNAIPLFPKGDKPVDIPDEISYFCEGESEEWAQESCKQRARDKFQERGDWNAVLSAFAAEAKGHE